MTEQCVYIKRNGERCKGRAKKGRQHCGPHCTIVRRRIVGKRNASNQAQQGETR